MTRTILVLILLLILIYMIRIDTKDHENNNKDDTVSVTQVVEIDNTITQPTNGSTFGSTSESQDMITGITNIIGATFNTSSEILGTVGSTVGSTMEMVNQGLNIPALTEAISSQTKPELSEEDKDIIRQLSAKKAEQKYQIMNNMVSQNILQEKMLQQNMLQEKMLQQKILQEKMLQEKSLDDNITDNITNEEQAYIQNKIQSIGLANNVMTEAPIKYPVNFLRSETKNQVSNEINNKKKCVNPIIYNYLQKGMIEGFENTKEETKVQLPNQVSFKKINADKLYYGLPCKYIKNDSFYDALKEYGFQMTDGVNTTIVDASLIVPCSYETTEKEIKDLTDNGISRNKYGDGVRIFMLNNTDLMVSKLALWKFLVSRYGENVASTMIPYTWDLTTDAGVEQFKKEYNPNKIYITKNNNQRQEGIQIHNSLQSVLDSRGKALLVQELLQNPYTISGRKINLRVYVLVMKDSLGNFKILIYNNGFMYYTPELFEKNNPDFKKNITTGYIDRQVYVENPLTHQDFREYLDSNTRTLTPIEAYIKQSRPNIKLSDYVFSQIYHLLSYIVETYDDTLGTKSQGVNFQLYGADIAIDEDLRPQIMEINKGPDLSAKDERDKKLKIGLSKDMLKTVGLVPDDSSNGFINVLERVNINGKKIIINNFMNK